MVPHVTPRSAQVHGRQTQALISQTLPSSMEPLQLSSCPLHVSLRHCWFRPWQKTQLSQAPLAHACTPTQPDPAGAPSVQLRDMVPG
jgi:hypothetical protein